MASDQTLPATASAKADAAAADTHAPSNFKMSVLGSMGVVFGDIGTSPLYALRETIAAAAGEGHAPTPTIVLGVLSIILWALVLVVTCKYVLILLRADNNGEGGTLTLVALAQRAMGRGRRIVLILGIAGAALFYGDAAITPAVTVLGAVEGLKLAIPALQDYVVPITIVILVALFAVQSRGTGNVAAFFGPVMAVWFATLALLGLLHIWDYPGIFAALSPHHAVRFLLTHPGISLIVLGAACLAVTGAEALYADLGHFGRGPIRFAWLWFVFPALALNYLGQGALVLANPVAAASHGYNPFFQLAPSWGLLPLVLLATLASCIASQAVITGAFSLTRQAIQLGMIPRLEIRYTSASHAGQIYMPRVNMLLFIAVLLLVAIFQSSSGLANAYGIAVFGAMSVDAILAILVIWRGWRWSLPLAAAMIVPFLCIDLVFFAANCLKLFKGGFVPLMMAALLILLMWTWVKGTAILFAKTRKTDVPLGELLQMLQKSPPHKVKGTAVFLTSMPDFAPSALLHNLKHNKVLHEKNIILTVRSEDTPRVDEDARVHVEPLGEGFWKVEMAFGYMETPNVPRGLAILRKLGLKFDIMATSFFLSRRSIRPAAQSGMPLWQDRVFISLAKNANDATDFFQIPTGRVVEVGTQVTV